MCLIRHRLSVVERLVGIRVVLWVRHQGGLVSKEDSRTGTLSFLGVSGEGFSGEGIALTFAVFPDEPTQTKPSSPSQKSTLLPWQAGAQ